MIITPKTLQVFLAASMLSSSASAARLGRKWSLEIVWNETTVLSNATFAGEAAKLGFCEGICGTDNDCQGDLICIEVPYEDSETQKCSLEVSSLNLDGYVLSSMEAPLINDTDNLITVDGEDLDGDFGTDGDPSFISNATIAISKRQGSISPQTIRFCAHPPTDAPVSVAPTDTPTTPAPSTGMPTLAPTTGAPSTLSPTDAPSLRPTPESRWQIPRAPEPKTAVLVGNPPPNDYKLQRCEGDCDSDGDCADGLVCRNRNGGEEVPGCVFGSSFFGSADINEDTDFCVQPDPHNNLRLRMYWENGYFWQENSNEQYFCMSHGWGQGNDLSCEENNRRELNEVQDEANIFGASIGAKKVSGSVRVRGLKKEDKDDNKNQDDDKNRDDDDDKNRDDDDDKNRDDDDDKNRDDDKNNDKDNEKEEEEEKDRCSGNQMCWYGEEERSCDPNRIYLDTCSGSDSRQRFDFVYQSTGEVLIKARSRTNRCLKGGRPRLA